MANYIPENILEDILSRIDIAELISGYFPLKRAGRNFKALCPFHHEKTPSFMVNPQKQIYHCFGCQKGGNAFNFLMEYERMDFIEAVKTLASKAGVELPQEGTGNKTTSLISGLYEINEFACTFYQNGLNSASGISAREYFNKRGMEGETVGLFRLGFALDKWDSLLGYLRSKNISLGLLEKSGLFCSRQEGGYYDRFRNRIIFPIFDIKNRVVAFGARVRIDNSQSAKYINSPESIIYVKGKHLYGLNLSRDSIRQSDCAIVVEGYFDCITVYQAGIKNLVASLGTSLTLEQIKLLKRYTHNIIMVYDSDQAGQEATLRNLNIFIQEGINVRVALLPTGSDPDSFLRKFGAEAFKNILNNAKGLFDYKLEILCARHNIALPEGKTRIAQEMLDSLSNFKDAVLQSEYMRRLAGALDINEESLIIELKKMKDKINPDLSGLIRNNPSKINPTEKLFIQLILRQTELADNIKAVLCADDFQDVRIGRLFSLICDLSSQGKAIAPNRLIGYLDDHESTCLISELSAIEEIPDDSAQEVLDDCVARIKKQRLNSKCQSLQKQIKIAQQKGDQEQLNRLIVEMRDLLRMPIYQNQIEPGFSEKS
ncbi:MAG: DNA primase [Candidatus Omnitrophota bacterium]